MPHPSTKKKKNTKKTCLPKARLVHTHVCSCCLFLFFVVCRQTNVPRISAQSCQLPRSHKFEWSKGHITRDHRGGDRYIWRWRRMMKKKIRHRCREKRFNEEKAGIF